MRRPGAGRGRGLAAAFALLVPLGLLLVSGCAREEEPPPPPPDTTAAPPDTAPAIRFARYPLSGASDFEALVERVGWDGFETVLRLNRIDSAHVWKGDTIVVPEPVPEPMALSPFPDTLAAARDLPKLFLVSLRVQAWGAYEFGRLAQWGPTSTGKRSTPTAPGLYHTNWKSIERRSTVNENWILRWYFNIENLGGCSIHQYDLPGYPASHSCLRMLREDAAWVYHWADQWRLSEDGNRVLEHGTPVVIFEEWAWGEPGPWMRLPEDPRATEVPAAAIEEALAEHGLAHTRFVEHLAPDRWLAEVRLAARPTAGTPDSLGEALGRLRGFRFRGWNPAESTLVFTVPHARLDWGAVIALADTAGAGVETIRLSGTALAQRTRGVAAFVGGAGRILLRLESFDPPGGRPFDHPVEVRFEGRIAIGPGAADEEGVYRLTVEHAERSGSRPLASGSANAPGDTR